MMYCTFSIYSWFKYVRVDIKCVCVRARAYVCVVVCAWYQMKKTPNRSNYRELTTRAEDHADVIQITRPSVGFPRYSDFFPCLIEPHNIHINEIVVFEWNELPRDVTSTTRRATAAASM